MAHPYGSDDYEWIELRVVNELDLNGLLIGRDGETPLEALNWHDDQCQHRVANDYVLLAKSTDPLKNGGLVEVDGTFGFNVLDTASVDDPRTLELWWAEDVIDSVTYAKTTEGIAAQLDSQLGCLLLVWCNADMSYGPTVDVKGERKINVGTPRATNSPCP